MLKIYNISEEEREELGKMGKNHIEKNYNFNNFCDNWVQLIDKIVEEHGSWDTRKGFKPYTFMEIV